MWQGRLLPPVLQVVILRRLKSVFKGISLKDPKLKIISFYLVEPTEIHRQIYYLMPWLPFFSIKNPPEGFF